MTDHFQPWNRRLGIIDRVATLGPGGDSAWAWYHALQFGVRFSYLDLSAGNIAGGEGQSATFGLNWYWTPRARLQVNCVVGDISEHRPVDGQTSGDFATLGTRVLVDF